MGYRLGVDLGTTFTAAAIARDGRVEMVTLGDRSAVVPSVVLLRADGSVLTGDAADRRAAAEPDRVAREVKRRLGDPMPVLLGGAPQSVQELMARQLDDVVRTVSEREGGAPDVVTLTHPANWGPYKRELFGQVPRLAGLDGVRMVTEPEAAAAHYAAAERVPDDALVAVYDLGGGTFDATVLRAARGGFTILGVPEGIEGLGGIDFDEAVYAHVDRAVDGAASALDPADARATAAAIRLRQECVLAKEALSADTETSIPVLLPSVQTEVRLTRGELEEMIRPSVAATVEAMRRALASAGVTAAELHTVLLVGGSSRIPAVARTVAAELGRPTAVDTHPKHAVALGAAAWGATTPDGAAAAAGPTGAAGGEPGPAGPDDTPTPPRGIPWVPPASVPAERTRAAAVPAGPETTLPTPVTPGPDAPAAGTPPPVLAPGSARPRRARRTGVIVGAGLLVAAAAVGGTLVYGASAGTPPDTSPPPVVATSEAPAATTEEVPTAEPADDDSAEPTRPARVRTTSAAPDPVEPDRQTPKRTATHTPEKTTETTTETETTSTESTTEEPAGGAGG
ncbi:Hsp70 family protein [Pseudonocardia sp. C8]|uniref:Hsp70 family protein n=1 Tax=Pseudonocardia sp. C8 TaxID=2762759 RepID=UPI001642F499|nr:Hsp70 family protein [Pseudonocardia sp. C8]MBC3190530.1 Hsp70 family protein [Pseudonocardia sp. C8]